MGRELLKSEPVFLAKMQECDRLFQVEGAFDYAKFVDCDRDFHKLIMLAARNQRIGTLSESVYPHIQLLRVYCGRSADRAWKSHREHLEIFHAIEARNEDEVGRVLREHITGSCEDVIRLLTEERHPLVTEPRS